RVREPFWGRCDAPGGSRPIGADARLRLQRSRDIGGLGGGQRGRIADCERSDILRYLARQLARRGAEVLRAAQRRHKKQNREEHDFSVKPPGPGKLSACPTFTCQTCCPAFRSRLPPA